MQKGVHLHFYFIALCLSFGISQVNYRICGTDSTHNDNYTASEFK